jgi:hypothetical protein
VRRTSVFFALALAVLEGAHGQVVKDPVRQGPVRVSSRAQLIASLAQSRVQIGDPIILHFRLKNVSSGVISPIFYNGFNDDYWVIVTDASGVELPHTQEGDRLREPSTVWISYGRGGLNPGVDDGDRVIDVGKLYHLDRPGSYFVRIARRMGVPPDIPFPKYPEVSVEEIAKVPIEEAVSDLIPFTIVPSKTGQRARTRASAPELP